MNGGINCLIIGLSSLLLHWSGALGVQCCRQGELPSPFSGESACRLILLVACAVYALSIHCLPPTYLLSA